jgi:hypothetical protein
METGIIVGAARRDARGFVTASLVLVILLAAVLGVNWKYTYNWFAGPFPLDASVAEAPGAREWVQAQGATASSGVVQTLSLKLFRGLVRTPGAVTAEYRVMDVGGRPLLVQVPNDFSGTTVEGRLEPLSDEVREKAELGDVYPWLLVATSYRTSANLFVLIAGPLLPLSLLMLGYAVWAAGRLERHAAFAALKHLGAAPDVAFRIEREMIAAGRSARVGPWTMTGSWVVSTEPTLHLYPVQDLVGVAHEKTTSKSGERHAVRVWARNRPISDAVSMEETDARTVLAGVASRWPWAVVDDAAAFEKRWRSEREACERAADAARQSPIKQPLAG